MSFLDPAFVVMFFKYILFNGMYFEYLQNAYRLNYLHPKRPLTQATLSFDPKYRVIALAKSYRYMHLCVDTMNNVIVMI
jgi:hypothetical protein